MPLMFKHKERGFQKIIICQDHSRVKEIISAVNFSFLAFK
jgi:predicted glycosyltransferase